MLDNDDIQEFKKLWQEEYGENLPDDVALSHAINYLTLLDKIYRRMPQQWMDDVIAKEAPKY